MFGAVSEELGKRVGGPAGSSRLALRVRANERRGGSGVTMGCVHSVRVMATDSAVSVAQAILGAFIFYFSTPEYLIWLVLLYFGSITRPSPLTHRMLYSGVSIEARGLLPPFPTAYGVFSITSKYNISGNSSVCHNDSFFCPPPVNEMLIIVASKPKYIYLDSTRGPSIHTSKLRSRGL